MKIIMAAPEPYFRPRGTPFSIADRLKGLSTLDYSVHLVTYPFGQDLEFPHVIIDRIPHVPFIKDIRVGPSLAKIPLDVVMFFKCMWILVKDRSIVAIHTHEEAALIGIIARFLFRIPHIYDMHSSLYQQMDNFKFTKNPVLLKIIEFLEKMFLKYSDAIIVICPSLEDRVKHVVGNRQGVFLIENLPLWEDFENNPESIAQKKKNLGINDQTVLFYAGTFEPYQGLDLLVDSAEIIARKRDDFLFLIIGGNQEQVANLQEDIDRKGLSSFFLLTGQKPHHEIAGFAELSDILISPRKTGTNTPLKIYSYLKSGKPIVATNLSTHTQVLNERVACLVPPDPIGLAKGLLTLMDDPDRGKKLAESARNLAEEKFTFPKYLQKLGKMLDYIFQNQ